MITKTMRTPPRVGSSQELLLVEADVVSAAGLVVTVGVGLALVAPVGPA